MSYIKMIINMLRSALYDIFVQCSNGFPKDNSVRVYDIFAEERIEVIRRIANSLESLECDFCLFLDICKEYKKDE